MLLCDVNSAFVRLLATSITIWFLVTVGIHRLCENYFTVSHMQVDDVAGIQMLWQRS